MRDDPVFATPALLPNALRDRTVVITGASDGVGRALAERCASAGGHVVMVGRNTAKTTHAASRIMNTTGSRSVTVETADLLYVDEQTALAQRLRQRHPAIHALVNNAGAIFLEREVTRDGLERTFALNHVAYCNLSLQLLPALRAAARSGSPARIINVASRAHRSARLDLEDLQATRRYSGWRTYANSKLANILATRTFASRLDPAQVTVHALHPGLVASRFAANNGAFGRLQRTVMDWFSVSVLAGSDTAAWLLACAEAGASTGDYWVRRERTEPSTAAQSATLAGALWTATVHAAQLDDSALDSTTATAQSA